MGEAWVRPNAGDVGNIRTDISGSGTFEISTEFWKLGSNDNFDVAGLVIVLHADEEDFAQECFDAHDHAHNNPKIACGTIQLIIND
jgi:Cu/Zn superoxide dismutase